jgi:hypothetical protein
MQDWKDYCIFVLNIKKGTSEELAKGNNIEKERLRLAIRTMGIASRLSKYNHKNETQTVKSLVSLAMDRNSSQLLEEVALLR